MTTPIQPAPDVIVDPKTPVIVSDFGALTLSVATALSPAFSKLVEEAEGRTNNKLEATNTKLDTTHAANKELITTIAGVAQEGIAVNSASIQKIVDSFGGTIAATLKANPRVTCALIIGSVATVWVGCLAVLIAYLVGAPDAKGVIGWAGAAFAATTGGAGILHQLGFLGTTATAPVPVPIVAPAAALAAPFVVPVPEGGNT